MKILFKNPIKDLYKTGGDAKLTNQVKDKKNSQNAMINENVTEELNYGKVSGTVQ